MNTTVMENNMPQTPPKVAIECKTTPTPSPSNELRKPDHLKLPKPFKYPERYSSPTDMMMSPVTKGLLARNKKRAAATLLPPKYQPPKVPEMCFKDGEFNST